MKNSKSTKRALTASIVSLVLCVTMLIGTTFAWFTDTASTSVNTIQAGTLDVTIVDENDSSLEGQTLTWQKAEGHTDEEIFWEPGCTYDLNAFKIKNNGNLALKYKVIINGVDGDNDLLPVIDFTVQKGNDAAVALNSWEGKLAAGNETEAITISGHMKETAGNKYQDKKLEDVSITVLATQDTVEYDSTTNTYDEKASYAETIAGGKEITSGTITLDTGIVATEKNTSALTVSGNETQVTIEDGYFDGGSNGNNTSITVTKGATLTIKNGTFTVGGDAKGYGNSVIYSSYGNITIEGGFFQTDYQYKGRYYVLNQDNNNPGTITVKGGTFVNYDPSTGDDNLGGTFVATGYKVTSETQSNGDVWYTVVPE